MASDFGVGAVYHNLLRARIPTERHLIFGYSTPSAKLISTPHGDHITNQYSLNRTESISLLYEAIRNRRIQCYAWHLAEPFLSDFMNLIRAPEETLDGKSVFRYRAHPSKPNDALHAVNYCFMLGRILLGEPVFSDLSMRSALERTLRSQPGGYGGGVSTFMG
jgi:hypothetical protein